MINYIRVLSLFPALNMALPALANFSFSGSKATQVADINGDGLADLVRVEASSIEVKLNLGSNTFGSTNRLLSIPYYGSRATTFADINGDGFDDAVVVNDSEIVVKYNLSGKGFGPHVNLLSTPYYGTRATAFADINGDGYDDAVVVNESVTVVKFNNRAGGFGANTVIYNGPYYGTKATSFADINGDGYDDFIVVNDGSTVVKYNNRANGFGPNVMLLGYPYYGTVATLFGDINNDATDDLWVINTPGVVVKLNHGNGSFSSNILLQETRSVEPDPTTSGKDPEVRSFTWGTEIDYYPENMERLRGSTRKLRTKPHTSRFSKYYPDQGCTDDYPGFLFDQGYTRTDIGNQPGDQYLLRGPYESFQGLGRIEAGISFSIRVRLNDASYNYLMRSPAHELLKVQLSVESAVLDEFIVRADDLKPIDCAWNFVGAKKHRDHRGRHQYAFVRTIEDGLYLTADVDSPSNIEVRVTTLNYPIWPRHGVEYKGYKYWSLAFAETRIRFLND